MTVGTKSVLAGAHCFFLHPLFVAWGWWRLYGFPLDPRLWAAFFLHDIGYIGKPNMDGPEGERHPEVGARIMHWLFDSGLEVYSDYHEWNPRTRLRRKRVWHDFCLYHSRRYAARAGEKFSRLCVADKLAFILTPKWMYLPMVLATGEIAEYMNNDQGKGWLPTADPNEWHSRLIPHMLDWVNSNRGDGREQSLPRR